MQKYQLSFSKTHDLVVLVKACVSKEPLWEVWIEEMDVLTRYAVLFRYPGESATKEDASCAVHIMRKHRKEIRLSLGLSE